MITTIIVGIVCTVLGWLSNDSLAGRWRKSRSTHRFADKEYLHAIIAGDAYLFTDSELQEPRKRALREGF